MSLWCPRNENLIIAQCCFKRLTVLETWHSVSLKSHIKSEKCQSLNKKSNYVRNKLWEKITKQMLNFTSKVKKKIIIEQCILHDDTTCL